MPIEEVEKDSKCGFTAEQVKTLLTQVDDIATRLGLMDGKIDSIETKVDTVVTEVTTDVIWQVCCVCKGLGYLVKVYDGPNAHTDHVVCEQCLGAKRMRFGEQQPTMPT